MNETKTPDIQAMLEWLASCPLAASLNDGDVAFSIDYLGAEPCQFSLESTPTAPILEQYIRGSLRAKNYVLASPDGHPERGGAGREQLLLGRLRRLGGDADLRAESAQAGR